MTDEAKQALTVGAVRKLIEGLPDEAPFFPHWANGPPSDQDPAIQVFGFKAMNHPYVGKQTPGIAILVDIIYLDDIEDEDEDEDEDEEEDKPYSCRLCGEPASEGGDGYDGLCPGCADGVYGGE